MKNEESGPVLAGKWNILFPTTFSGFASRVRSSPRRPKWFTRRCKSSLSSRPRQGDEQTPSSLRSRERDLNVVDILTLHRYDSPWDDHQELDNSLQSLGPEDLSDPTLRCFSSYEKDDSFDTVVTEMITLDSDEASDSTEDDSTSFCECTDIATTAGSSMRSVRFADEEGLPMEQIVHLQPSREEDRDDSELVMLCLSPQHKKFEFVHVGYYTQDTSLVGDSPLEDDHTATSVSDLLQHLPTLCTDPVFANAKFDSLYRTNKSCGAVEKLTVRQDASDLLLRDCNLNPLDIVVAAVSGSSDDDVVGGINPLLSNVRLMKQLKRARRSQRGLKWIPQERDVVIRTSPGLAVMINATNVIMQSLSDGLDLFFGDDEGDDQEHKSTIDGEKGGETRERFEQEMMQGIVLVTGLTLAFSLLGM